MQDLESSIQTLVDSATPFYAYKLPDEDLISLAVIADSQAFVYEDLDRPSRPEGFVVYPFDDSSGKGWCFIPENIKHFYLSQISTSPGTGTEIIEDYESAGFVEYASQFAMMKEAINTGEVRKVILSRTLSINKALATQAGGIFSRMLERYHKAFVYMISAPQIGLWTGASPELLFSRQNDLCTTVSLAGTRLQNHGEKQWSLKETEEQEVVSDYIDKILNSFNIASFVKQGPEIINAGNLIHLKTTYTFNSCDSLGVAQFVKALHPTPALCGEPKDKAMALIKRVEKHPRLCYGGFIGPVGPQALSLYVNIRCMKIDAEVSTLYVGGGLTRLSDLHSEWDETSGKSKTLLSVISE